MKMPTAEKHGKQKKELTTIMVDFLSFPANSYALSHLHTSHSQFIKNLTVLKLTINLCDPQNSLNAKPAK